MLLDTSPLSKTSAEYFIIVFGSQLLDMKLTVEGLEKERDFYFGKLRDIELICQENENKNPVVSRIIEILYATEVKNSTTSTILKFEPL